MSIRRLNTQQPDFAAKFSELVAVDSSVDPEITRRAEAIVQDVRARGDEAVLEYTNRFDHMDAKSVAEFRLTEDDLKEALETPSERPERRPDSGCSTYPRVPRTRTRTELVHYGRRRNKARASATFRSIPSVSMFLAVKPRTRLPF